VGSGAGLDTADKRKIPLWPGIEPLCPVHSPSHDLISNLHLLQKTFDLPQLTHRSNVNVPDKTADIHVTVLAESVLAQLLCYFIYNCVKNFLRQCLFVSKIDLEINEIMNT
jgi:hypothetical protein